MYIKPLDEHKKYDIFLGHGWDNWVRVRFDKNKVEVVDTSVEDLDPSTLRLIYFKLKKLVQKEKQANG